MGWTHFHFNGTIQEFIEKEFMREPSWGEIIDHSKVGNTLYLALKLGPKHGEREGLVTALVILLRKSRDYYNFGYKDMSESCGPVESKCPKRIINLLSPLDKLYEPGSSSYEWAKAWRERCMNQKAGKKVEEGTVIKLPNPIRFNNGGMFSTFRKMRRNRWMAMIVGRDNELIPSCLVSMRVPPEFEIMPIEIKTIS